MNDELRFLCRRLKLGHVAQAAARVKAKGFDTYLLDVLNEECRGREQSRLKKLLKKADFSHVKTLEEYSFDSITFPGSCSEETLTSLAFLERSENVLMLGAVGTGKTHLAIALGFQACKLGKETRFFRVADLINKLQERHGNGTLAAFLRGLRKADLVILDEVGYVPFHKTGSELLFNLISDCYEKRSIIVTSNLEFGRWNSIFGDTHMTQALVDRLVHHAHILGFIGESYRLRQAMSASGS